MKSSCDADIEHKHDGVTSNYLLKEKPLLEWSNFKIFVDTLILLQFSIANSQKKWISIEQKAMLNQL